MSTISNNNYYYSVSTIRQVLDMSINNLIENKNFHVRQIGRLYQQIGDFQRKTSNLVRDKSSKFRFIKRENQSLTILVSKGTRFCAYILVLYVKSPNC